MWPRVRRHNRGRRSDGLELRLLPAFGWGLSPARSRWWSLTRAIGRPQARARRVPSACSSRRPLNIDLSRVRHGFLARAPRLLAAGAHGTELSLVESTYLYLATCRATPHTRAARRGSTATGVPVACTIGCARRALSLAQPRIWRRAPIRRRARAGLTDMPCSRRLRGANSSAGGAVSARSRRRVRAVGRIGASRQQGSRPPAASACRYAVNAAGTRSRELAASVGVELPVFARKRNVFVFTCPAAIARCPLVIDPSGLWFRPERDRFLCGPPSDPDPDVCPDDFEVDYCVVRKLRVAAYWHTACRRSRPMRMTFGVDGSLRLQRVRSKRLYRTRTWHPELPARERIQRSRLAAGARYRPRPRGIHLLRTILLYRSQCRYPTPAFAANAPLREFNVI